MIRSTTVTFYSFHSTGDGESHRDEPKAALLSSDQVVEQTQLGLQKEREKELLLREKREQQAMHSTATMVNGRHKTLKKHDHDHEHEQVKPHSHSSVEHSPLLSPQSSHARVQERFLACFLDELYHAGIVASGVVGWAASFYLLYYTCQLSLARVFIVYLSLLIVCYCFQHQLLARVKKELLHFPRKFMIL